MHSRRLGMYFLLWLISLTVHGQVIFKSLYSYDNQQSYNIPTKIEINDSIKVYSYTNEWNMELSYKIDVIQTYGKKEIIKFTNEHGTHLIAEYDYYSLILRTDQNYHTSRKLILYFNLYNSG